MPLSFIPMEEMTGLCQRTIKRFGVEKHSDLPTGMTDHESDFLLYLLAKKNPGKILQIGAGSGGTSALILNVIQDNQRLYSVDSSKIFYQDEDSPTGFIVDALCQEEQKRRHTKFYGYDVIEVIEEIGGDIDFVIIDTGEDLPGELLTLIALVPLLAGKAHVLLHNIGLDIATGRARKDFLHFSQVCACKIAFSSIISRHKYVPDMPFANISCAVFEKELREDTIHSIFHNLSIPWSVYPGDLIPLYQDFISQYYDSKLLQLFNDILPIQSRIVALRGDMD